MKLLEVNLSSEVENKDPEKNDDFEGETCHYCNKKLSANSFAKCKVTGCGKQFCRKCLTSKYKFSKLKAAQLPTPLWKCPSCTFKCLCVM